MIKPNYDRVTDVIGVFSGLDKIDPAILKNAGDRGTCVHAIIDKMIESPSFFCAPMMEEMVNKYTRNTEHSQKEMNLIQNMLQSFERWADGKKFDKKPDRFYCDDLKITGEIDAISLDSAGLTLIDFKTPISESPSWLLQASAYSYLGEKSGYPFCELQFIALCRKGGLPKVYTYEARFDLFKSCLDVYRYFYKDKKFDMEIDYL